jgi:glucose-6-phosphate isomerase
MSLVSSAPWQALAAHQPTTADIRALFAADPQRFEKLSLQVGPILMDYSRQAVTEDTIHLLADLARHQDLAGWLDRMLAGDKINDTEDRAVRHMDLRASQPPADVQAVLAQMDAFVAANSYDTIVNIGIGGSDLGPQMVVESLRAFVPPGKRAFFVSNTDGTALADVLAVCDPTKTLFIIASKTFTTQETLLNAGSALAWARGHLGDTALQHFVGVTASPATARSFGLTDDRIFPFWDWVGGRFSLWSAIGLSIALTLGMDHFRALLAGAALMDQHFKTAPFERNMPVLLGLLGIWNTNFRGAVAHAVLPYAQHLHRLPAYLQQLEMESNGKGTDRTGRPVDYATCPVVFGEPGTNGQHAFYQLLHQGTIPFAADLIAVKQPMGPLNHHAVLLANCLAQGEAFLVGRPDPTRPPHQIFAGNKPTTTLLLDRLDPESLGALIALYEHKVFVQGVIWHINSFDQWGVELGKQLARPLLPELEGGPAAPHDASTQALVQALRPE